ncbi:SusC/RagA family TonB-linked outer membrane protein [Hoylesella nanceiensis]|jgi:tonB-linked outer membrane protein, susC/ragA family|uniref:SusC/RagA family TonB-linked outer membrane protein n=1 Tax=Hoylesella nanceiensis TaxID=425941 RepID=UPI001C5D5A9A|nr:SusC/RagA family TonB-linked outer membrane protein [Hoylesella nanceiensis]MBF1428336.1 SusC/RagA family TonB-linked outer membrane protein [Hoylesella nanceiensis]MBF1441305.1 SusC/RagA family TonB-linked outer membrane protein [Hoylesella nanceiensis]MBW4835220.1 SusC/RagA family TonB-linked outer membrane protein [Hoylesella nanceiensis]
MKSNKHLLKETMLKAAFGALIAMAPIGESKAQVTLKTPNTTLEVVIKKIQKQMNLRFFYDDSLAKVMVNNIDVKDEKVQNVLNQLLKGKGISFKVEDNVVYLRKENAPVAKEKATDSKRKITGKVLDEAQQPMIGVTVAVKGSTTRAVTDIDGNYQLQTSETAPVLQFSYLGYKTKEVKASGKDAITTTMDVDSKALDEVVVTALGIKRDKKMLGYSVQDIKSDALNTTGDPSVVGALSGKVAGLQMNTASTGLGGSTKITIRGNSSLTDNNQPLWIVDGVPFSDNNTSNASAYGGYDRGGTSLDINPDDIESISVLKGPNAAALYGSRAGNGVILVTTKKGANKSGFGVSYNGNFTWSSVSQAIKMQNRFGQGSNGAVNYKRNASGDIEGLNGELSFGPELDGHEEYNWYGTKSPYQYTGDKLRDYFKTGFSQFHTVALGNNSEKGHYRLSIGYNDNKGLFKNETLDKLSIDLNAGTVVNKYLSLDGKISLSHMKACNRPLLGLNGEVAQLLLIPGNVSLRSLEENQSSETQIHRNWFGPNQHYSNPYYVRHRYKNSDERWRAFGYYGANINLLDNLKLNAKYSFDYYRTRLQTSDLSLADQAITTGTSTWQEKITTDGMQRGEENHFEHNIQMLLLGNNQLTPKLRVDYSLGGNVMYQKYELFQGGVQNMLNKDVWVYNTGGKLVSGGDNGFNRAMYSVFASAQLAYSEYLSLDLTARNDWSSTLPKGQNSFFYPSASISFMFSDFMKSIDKPLPSWVTFAKIRTSLAQVGKDPSPYNLYNTRKFEFESGIRKPVVNTIKMNDMLKPEIKTSYELGLDMKFLNNRLGFDFTYYYSVTRNQSMLVDAAAPWSQQWVNAGKILNRGVEMMVYTTPIQTKDLTFNLNMNFAHNRSIVKELAPGVQRIYFNGDNNMPVRVGAVVGGKLGDIYANNLMKRNDAGQVIVNAQGLPQPATGNGNLEQYLLSNPIGNIQPDLLMSVTPSLTFKGISLTAMFDMRFGGSIMSVSEGMATSVGTSERTLNRGEYKEISGVKDYYMVVPGVKEDGSINDIPVSAQAYYSTIGIYKSQKGYAEEFIHSASYIKLKELSLGYSFPQRMLKKTPFTALKLSFVARNLCFLMKHTPGNPDGGYDTTMFSQALDFAAVPYTRTFGFSINVGF